MTEKSSSEELEKAANDQVSLKKQLKLLSIAIEQSSEGIAVVDLDGNLEYLNNAFAEMHGYSAEELAGKNLSVFHTPEQMPSIEAANLEIKQTGNFKGEIWHIRRDGTVFPTIMHNSLIRDETNKPIGMIGTLRDITDIKQTDEALRKSEKQLSNHLLNTPVGAISRDLDFKVAEWNPAAETIFGYTKEEAVGKHTAELILSEDMKGPVHEIFQDLLSARGGTRSTNENITKDGRWIICDWYNTTLKDIDGRVTGVASLVHDITERTLFEKSLRESEERYRSLVESTEDSVFTADRNGRYLFANNKYLSVHGLEVDGYIDKTYYDFHTEKAAKIMMERLNQIFETGESAIYENKDEQDNIYFIKTLSPIKSPDAKTIAVTSISKDITKRRNAEEALRKINDELEIRIENRTKELEIKSRNLEELNTALNVLLKKRDEDNIALEEKMLTNINHLIEPMLGKLKKSRLDKTQEVLVDILESYLKDIISPFTRNLSAKYLNLTPSEIQIANLLKQGKITKEIAELLSLSPRTIEGHRKNIRKKLGLTNKKSNLQTHLMAVQ